MGSAVYGGLSLKLDHRYERQVSPQGPYLSFAYAIFKSWLPALLLASEALTNPASFAKDTMPPKMPDNAKGADISDKPRKDDDINLPTFPTDKTVHQSISLDGHELKYEATVGSLPVLDEKGKTIASVVFTAYTVPGANRAVTFALNGGPGAASEYVNLGAIGQWGSYPRTGVLVFDLEIFSKTP